MEYTSTVLIGIPARRGKIEKSSKTTMTSPTFTVCPIATDYFALTMLRTVKHHNLNARHLSPPHFLDCSSLCSKCSLLRTNHPHLATRLPQLCRRSNSQHTSRSRS
jgi:hypothetical protein